MSRYGKGFENSRTPEINAVDIKQNCHGNHHYHAMGSNNLICFGYFFRRSAFCRASLQSKTHRPVLVILATKIYYPNSRRQEVFSATLVGHLNNTFLRQKKNATRCYILETTAGNNSPCSRGLGGKVWRVQMQSKPK